ncbi:peptidase T [Spirochaeta lutea]|uniref:peptidase T n=1 Tax=Spirochaeta lutea TaxID=1480694 RepID=UPI0009DE1851|nr:peptidase T [Spirochaeta lutea]
MSSIPSTQLLTNSDYRDWFESQTLRRFLRYVQIFTTSDPHSDTHPTSDNQWQLARILIQELEELGITDVTLTDFCYVIARIPPSPGYETATPIGFLAHLDTAPDFSGQNVKPKVWESYDGTPLELSPGWILDPRDNPALLDYRNETLITSDGTTLLGADDKAGIAEIMAALAFLTEHPEFSHGPLEILFTPDEEVGKGVAKLPVKSLKSTFAYTLDGSAEGTYNAQCFTGYTIGVTFTGRMIHPGDARGIMANAVTMAGAFIAGLPRSESPEATDGEYGFYCPQEMSGSMEQAFFRLFIRDFRREEIDRRLEYLKLLAKTVEAGFPGGKVELSIDKQYLNIKEYIEPHPEVIANLVKAIEATGIPAVPELIRGGTDGARLSELGIPTPNIFAGGHNFHSRFEWIGLRAMVRAAQVVVNLSCIWAAGGEIAGGEPED